MNTNSNDNSNGGKLLPSVYSILFTERAEQANTIKRAIETGVFLSTKTGKPVKVNSLDSFNRYLRQQHGIIQVGQGYYSDAFVGGEGLSTAEYVLKVKNRDHKKDPWFDVYGPYCYENKPTNQLFPKVLYVGQPSWSDQPMALVEKLRFDYNYVDDVMHQVWDFWDYPYDIVDVMAAAIQMRADRRQQDKAFLEMFDELITELGSNLKDFTEFAKVIASIMPSSDTLDIHGNNMGWRANGELVISDPLG